MDLQLSQVLTQIVAFLIFLWILKRFAWGPLQKILDERKTKIQSEFDDIAREKNEVAEKATEYKQKLHDIDKEAKTKIKEATKEGEREAKLIKTAAEQRAVERLERANKEIEAEQIKAKDEMKKEIVKLSVQLAEKILEEKTTPEEHKKWMDDFVKEAHIK